MSFFDAINTKSEKQKGFSFPSANSMIGSIQKDLENQIIKNTYRKEGRTYETVLIFDRFESCLDISSRIVKEYRTFLSHEEKGKKLAYSCKLKPEAKQFSIDLEKALLAENIVFKGWGMASLFQVDCVDIFPLYTSDSYTVVDSQRYTSFWHENIPIDNTFTFYRDTKFAFFDNYILPSGKVVNATSIVLKVALKFQFTF